jgi:hypothetical protein
LEKETVGDDVRFRQGVRHVPSTSEVAVVPPLQEEIHSSSDTSVSRTELSSLCAPLHGTCYNNNNNNRLPGLSVAATLAFSIITITMKTSFVAAALVAVFAASGSNAFAPISRSDNGRSSTTSLYSHFTCINTKLYNKESLLKALKDLGIKNILQTSSNTNNNNENNVSNQLLEVRGHQGQTLAADIVIPQPNQYDVAFRYNGETYELVADLQFWQQSMPVDAFMEKVQQKYALHSLVDSSAQDGFQVEKVTTSVDGTVTLQMSRFNTAGM